MIFGNLESIANYKGISKNLDLAIDALIKDGINFKDVDISVDGVRTVWGGAGKYKDKEREEETVYEAHRKFIDIHLVLAGEELEGHADLSAATPTTEYNEQDDYVLLAADGNEFTLRAGDFAIHFPCDAHAPTITAKDLTKAVIKIRI